MELNLIKGTPYKDAKGDLLILEDFTYIDPDVVRLIFKDKVSGEKSTREMKTMYFITDYTNATKLRE